VGTVLAGHDGRRGFLYHLAVRERFRGRGIARALVERALRGLYAEGIRKCHIMAFQNNKKAHSFWTRIGFKRRNREIALFSRDIAPSTFRKHRSPPTR
jgi:ribosomal protein S18 acetylase RimI-like enzyme